MAKKIFHRLFGREIFYIDFYYRPYYCSDRIIITNQQYCRDKKGEKSQIAVSSPVIRYNKVGHEMIACGRVELENNTKRETRKCDKIEENETMSICCSPLQFHLFSIV